MTFQSKNLRDDINSTLREDNSGSSCNSLTITLKNSGKKESISSRIQNVFVGHNKPAKPEDPSKYQNPLKNIRENSTPSILNSYLFVENTKKS